MILSYCTYDGLKKLTLKLVEFRKIDLGTACPFSVYDLVLFTVVIQEFGGHHLENNFLLYMFAFQQMVK